MARTGTATVFPHTIAMAAFDPELLEQVADAIFTEDCAKYFAAHSGRTGFCAEKHYFEENREVWRALEDAHLTGKVKAIGVSNFLPDNLQNLLADCRVKNRLLHITSTDLLLLDFCRSHGILVGTYSPLLTAKPSRTPPFRKWRKNTAPPAQLCIRCALELGAVALP